MARTTYGKYFRTKKGRYGRYKYVNGKRVSFVASRKKFRSKRKLYTYPKGPQGRIYYPNRRY